ncbi:MAG TPA: serine/threonine-protein kinase [Drouetiella sp.]
MPEDKSQTNARKTCPNCKRGYFANLTVCPNCGQSNLDPFIGRTISNRFLVESIIGEGGMGVVYKASQAESKQQVAVKILRPELMNDELAVRRFKHEAVATSRLSHPHIVAMYDYGSTVDGYLFMVMEIIEGKSLAKLVHERRSLSAMRTNRIIGQVCQALEHAHQNGVIHRDLKPGNILLTTTDDEEDYVKLVDFGIAKLILPDGQVDETQIEQEGEVLGSPLYMSPEQCLGREIDGRCDIYALGVVLYETLMGKGPFVGRTAQETIEMQLQKAPAPFATKRPDLQLPARLEAVVFKALAKKAGERQQTMRQLALELDEATTKATEVATPRKFGEAAIRSPLKANVVPDQKVKIMVAAIVGLLVMIAIAGFAFKNVLFH